MSSLRRATGLVITLLMVSSPGWAGPPDPEVHGLDVAAAVKRVAQRIATVLPADCNHNHRVDSLDIDSGRSFDCNGNGVPDECDIDSGFSLDCDQNGIPDECAEFGLSIEYVLGFNEGGEDGYGVTTTGGVVRILPSHIDVVRRINPATNAIDPNAPTLARITFDNPVGELSVTCQTAQSCLISSAGGLDIDIRADSLVFLKGRSNISYIYESLLSNPTWTGYKKSDDPNNPNLPGDRMWARLGEGTIHMIPPGSAATVSDGADPDTQIDVRLFHGQRSAFAVFPGRTHDLDFLYGQDARPHVVYSFEHPPAPNNPTDFQYLADVGFGTIILFAGAYTDIDGNGEWEPDLIDGRLAYTFDDPNDPNYALAVHDYIDMAHQEGFKVVAYMLAGEFAGQDIDITLDWMREIQHEYDLDGWYLDGAQPNGADEWEKNYDFIRAVRRQIGDDGVIFHHTSVDVWGGFGSDVAFAPLEAWETYTLRGEVGDNAQVSGPNDQFIADICGSHGGALPAQKVRTKGADMIIAESQRLFQQNLWGYYTDNTWVLLNQPFWDDYGRPYWEARRQEYLAGGDFSMAFDWPPAWYHELDPNSDVSATSTPTTITVSFTTPVETYGQLRAVKNWTCYHFDHVYTGCPVDQPITVNSCTSETPHQVTVEGCIPGTDYRVLVRGFVGAPLACTVGSDQTMAEDVWGTVIVVSTPPDCNGNGVDDALDIANGTSCDSNGDGVPDECQGLDPYACPNPDDESSPVCPDADIDCSRTVDDVDLALITDPANWGKVVCSADPPAVSRTDVNRDGAVTGADLFLVQDCIDLELVYSCEEGYGVPDPGLDDCQEEDINCDGLVNSLDSAVVTNPGNWLKVVGSADPPVNPRADVNRDGVVNMLDSARITNPACWLYGE